MSEVDYFLLFSGVLIVILIFARIVVIIAETIKESGWLRGCLMPLGCLAILVSIYMIGRAIFVG